MSAINDVFDCRPSAARDPVADSCGHQHEDPLQAEVCEQFLAQGADPETAHDTATAAYEHACANGYGEPA